MAAVAAAPACKRVRRGRRRRLGIRVWRCGSAEWARLAAGGSSCSGRAVVTRGPAAACRARAAWLAQGARAAETCGRVGKSGLSRLREGKDRLAYCTARLSPLASSSGALPATARKYKRKRKEKKKEKEVCVEVGCVMCRLVWGGRGGVHYKISKSINVLHNQTIPASIVRSLRWSRIPFRSPRCGHSWPSKAFTAASSFSLLSRSMR